MQFVYCPYCRSYTPPKGERCGVCGMLYADRRPLSDAISEVRSDAASSIDPIRIRPQRGQTYQFRDGRMSEPFFAKVSFGGPGEYMIMDENSLRALIGPAFALDRSGVTRKEGKKRGKKMSVSYTRDAALIPSLNRRPRRSR